MSGFDDDYEDDDMKYPSECPICGSELETDTNIESGEYVGYLTCSKDEQHYHVEFSRNSEEEIEEEMRAAMYNEEGFTSVEKAINYRNSGYNPEGLFQNSDGSGYIILEHSEEGQVEVELTTKEEVEKIASSLGIDIQKSGV